MKRMNQADRGPNLPTIRRLPDPVEPVLVALTPGESATLRALARLRGETEEQTVAAIVRTTLEALAGV